MNIVRFNVVSLLTIVFLVACYNCWNKLRNPVVLTSTKTVTHNTLEFPSITVCPMLDNSNPFYRNYNKSLEYMYEEELPELSNNIIRFSGAFHFGDRFSNDAYKYFDLSNSSYYPINGTTFEDVWQFVWLGSLRLMYCYTLNLPGLFTVGQIDSVRLVLNTTTNYIFMISIHERGGFVPSSLPKFGNDPLQIEWNPTRPYDSEDGYVWISRYDISKKTLTKYKLPDEPPCFHQTRDNPNNCFMKTLAKRSGCNVPGLKDKFPMLGNCTETSQTNVYSGLAQDFVIQSEAKTMKTMNEKHCKIPCTMNYYDLTKLDDRLTKCHNEEKNTSACHHQMHLQFFISDGTVEVSKEDLLYGTGNFMADIGGYMGLLLGASVLTIHDVVMDLMKKYRKTQQLTVA